MFNKAATSRRTPKLMCASVPFVKPLTPEEFVESIYWKVECEKEYKVEIYTYANVNYKDIFENMQYYSHLSSCMDNQKRIDKLNKFCHEGGVLNTQVHSASTLACNLAGSLMFEAQVEIILEIFRRKSKEVDFSVGYENQYWTPSRRN